MEEQNINNAIKEFENNPKKIIKELLDSEKYGISKEDFWIMIMFMLIFSPIKKESDKNV